MPGTFYIETQTKDGLARIDIAATEVTIPISIVAAEVALPIKIIAQEVDIGINIVAQTVGVYLQPEWTVLQSQDKNFSYWATNKAWRESIGLESYYVPEGKTLYITGIQATIIATNQADADLPHHFWVEVTNDSETFKVQLGGDGGIALNFARPLRTDGGDFADFWLSNESNHNCGLYLCIQGYEI